MDSVEATNGAENERNARLLSVDGGAVTLKGILDIPAGARGVVLLAHGVESAEDTHQNALVQAGMFYDSGLATLLVDLISSAELQLDQQTGFFRNNVDIMQQRILGIAEWLTVQEETQNLAVGYFGTGVSASAVLIAAGRRPDVVRAIVAAGRTYEEAQQEANRVVAPTLLVAAERDQEALKANQSLLDVLTAEKQLEQIGGADSLFESKESISEFARRAGAWFTRWLEPIV